MKKNNHVKVLATSIKGPLHETKNLPCQDYCLYSTEGKNFVAVVSDGAGSAKYGRIGAKIVCSTIIDLLENADFKNIQKAILFAIEVARSKLIRHRLNKNKDIQNLNDFAATIVGIVKNKNKSVFFHLGDGAALGLFGKNKNDYIISKPHNGNFSCETYFYTMDDWQDFLRFTQAENLKTIFLMSDGLTNFAFSKNFETFEEGFILPINDYLEKEESAAKALRALKNTLNNAKAKKLNSDDKTLLWAKL